MEWAAGQAYLDALDADARRTLLGILTSPPETRAEAIGRLHVRDDGADLAELLIFLEEKEWAWQWFIERLSEQVTGRPGPAPHGPATVPRATTKQSESTRYVEQRSCRSTAVPLR